MINYKLCTVCRVLKFPTTLNKGKKRICLGCEKKLIEEHNKLLKSLVRQ